MLAGAGVGVATSYSLTVTMPLAGLVTCALIGHGLFVRGPVEGIDDLGDEVETLN